MTDRIMRARQATRGLHALLAKLRAEPALLVEEYEDAVIPAASSAEVDAFEAATGRTLPPELRACFREGLFSCIVLSKETEEVFAKPEFLSLRAIREQLVWWADMDLAEQLDEEAESGEPQYALTAKMLRRGVPIWKDESTVVIDGKDGAVDRFDGEGRPGDPICRDIGEFFEHFAAAGMFDPGSADRGTFDTYWAIVGDLVPFEIPRRDNKWLKHLDRWYEGDLTA